MLFLGISKARWGFVALISNSLPLYENLFYCNKCYINWGFRFFLSSKIQEV